MNAISIFKSFTLVMIFIAGVAVKAADKVETKEECKARVTKAQSAELFYLPSPPFPLSRPSRLFTFYS